MSARESWAAVSRLTRGLRDLAEVAAALSDELERKDAPRAGLREFLAQELEVDLDDPQQRHRLDEFVDEIIEVVVDPFIGPVVVLDEGLAGITCEYDEDEDRTRYLCLDCAEDTLALGENYYLGEAVWLEANPADKGMLCVGCVETRLGRKLRPDDFAAASVDYKRISDRLRARVYDLEEAPAA